MIFSLTVLPVHADVVEGEGTLTITPSITSAEAGADAIEVTYTIKVTPPEGKKVGGFSFKLSAPEGMSLPTKFKDGGATKIAYLNKGELEYSQEEETGIFENYSYTPSTGTFIANGTEASRMMETEYEILKIVTTIEAGKAGSFTLTAPDFEIYPNGTDKYTPKVVTTPVVVKAAVTDIPVESVSLDKTELKLAKGGNAKLTATVNPADATDKTVTWTTSKDKVAAVAADGTVTAVGEGTAVITATAGGKTAQCTVTVVNCLHTSKSLVAAKAATCTEKGMKEHYKCDTCSALFETEDSTTPVAASTLELPVIDHTFTDVAEKAATCTENGNIEHYKCTGCGKLFSDEAGATEIAAKDVVIPAAHKLTPVAEKPSTCRVNGTAAYDKCDVCGKMFDKDGKEITAPATLPLAAHTWDTTKWLANKDGHYRECKVCGIAGDVTAHTPGAEATETTPQTCTVCGYIIKPATSHKEHTKGNLMSDATSHWYACTGCSEQLEKANHTVTSWTVDKAATTTEEGLRHGNCSVCQHVVYEKLAKINNTPTTPSKPGRPSGTKTVQSGKTFDAGVGVYVGLSILSLTGSAVVIGKKRKTR